MAKTRALRPPPTPMHVDARLVVLVGTVLWSVAAVVLAAAWSWVHDHGHEIWLWTSLCGAGLGLLGLVVMRKHRNEGRL